MNGIKQAVILAGGKGERLKPITDKIPKPMVLINGRPFLEYLVEDLKGKGIEEIILLLGYLPDAVTNYFGDGEKFGIKIKYSISPVGDETGTRIKKAEEYLCDKFLLLYCDNYCPISLEKLNEFYAEKNKLATLTAYSNKYGYTKNNILIIDGIVEKYDRNRENEKLNGVDIGFFILSKKILDLIPDKNFSFEEIILPKLIQMNELSGYITDIPYVSIGKIERIKDAELYFSERKVIFLDRDGTINVRPPKAEYVKNWDEFKFLPGAIDGMKLLAEKNFEIYIITNQAGVARGFMKKNDLDDIHAKFHEELQNNGVKISGIYSCMHDWNEGCDCRKPKAGLFFKAALENKINLCKAFFIGDDERDLVAGKEAEIESYLISENSNLLNTVREKILA
ncbi:HAD-IIIA family hydrolase [Candidatus Giovannonibacteria bacterium]|nr:HAD-IIIA family hydrolase [Candidatus Giovannonibacteria bacterium]